MLLGLSYQMGEGLSEDSVYAHMWFSIVASQGNENALQGIEMVENEMSQT